MSVTISLTEGEAQKIANLAEVALGGDGHRPNPCPICNLASAVLSALERVDVRPFPEAESDA